MTCVLFPDDWRDLLVLFNTKLSCLTPTSEQIEETNLVMATKYFSGQRGQTISEILCDARIHISIDYRQNNFAKYNQLHFLLGIMKHYNLLKCFFLRKQIQLV